MKNWKNKDFIVKVDSTERLRLCWDFKEADRVPIEIKIYPSAQDLPGADEVVKFADEEADNCFHCSTFDWGFMGIDCESREEIIEDVPGDYKRVMQIKSTPVGEFTATCRYYYQDIDKSDCHWEKRFIETIDDLQRIVDAPRNIRPLNPQYCIENILSHRKQSFFMTSLLHPLGTLVRNSNMENTYSWLALERPLIKRFLETSNEQICASLNAADSSLLPLTPIFKTFALEMLITPWLGKDQFMELVFPYDSRVNEAIHKFGGKYQAHCHGNSGEYLELFADMGIDSIEPLEPVPYADNDLEKAKRQVGKRMVLGRKYSQSGVFS